MTTPRIITSVAPYVSFANAYEAIQLARSDGFAGLEFNEDHLQRLAERKPNALALVKNYSQDHGLTNSMHKTLHRPSIDSENERERRMAVDYTLTTLDYMESAGIPRIILHSFSDMPSFFKLQGERANAGLYAIGCHVIKFYGVLAPVLKQHRKSRAEKIQANFLRSLSEIAAYARDKRVNHSPIEVAFEEHYADYIDYEAVSYGKGKFSNVIRGVDTAHHLIRTGQHKDLSTISDPIHFHAVDTNGWIDDHRTIGNGRVKFDKALADALARNLTETIVLENATRKSAIESRDVIGALIRRQAIVSW